MLVVVDVVGTSGALIIGRIFHICSILIGGLIGTLDNRGHDAKIKLNDIN